MRLHGFFTCIVALSPLLTSCGPAAAASETSKMHAQSELSVLYAGSMTKVMEDRVRPQFNEAFHAMFRGEAAGSLELAQLIRSGMAKPDVFVSASPAVNRSLLMGVENHNLVTWYAAFARDELVIAYSPRSRFSSQLHLAATGARPWYEVLEQKGFLLGRTDPQVDPKGLSSIFMIKLAASYYHQPMLADRLLGSANSSSQVFPEEALLAHLESGQLDAVIAYRHEAVEWGMPYIRLPGAVNLGNPKLAHDYAKASYETRDGKIKRGAAILFTITIPKAAVNPRLAAQFVNYMVLGPGSRMLWTDGFSKTDIHIYGNAKDAPAFLRHVHS